MDIVLHKVSLYRLAEQNLIVEGDEFEIENPILYADKDQHLDLFEKFGVESIDELIAKTGLTVDGRGDVYVEGIVKYLGRDGNAIVISIDDGSEIKLHNPQAILVEVTEDFSLDDIEEAIKIAWKLI